MSDNPDVADAYSALLGALRLAGALASGNSILVTSAQPGDGKTTVSSCLALTASLAGQPTLLIDGDLRRSSLTAAVGSNGTVGLIEILLGEAEPAEAIRAVVASAESPRAGAISFMSSGRKSATFVTAVNWSRARSVFRSIAQEFSLVILDSPPVLAVNDALLLASVVDAVVLVADPGSTDRDELRQAKEHLDAIGTPVIGAILNQFEPKLHGRSNQPYRGYDRRSRT
jgi:capsular exopolysaccharide synthesis family protein